MPVRFAKRLPRYPTVPVARLGRLAVALAYHGRKLGGALLWDAIVRASRSEVAVYALVVGAKDEQAESFYLHHGFVAVGDTSRTLITPLPKRKGTCIRNLPPQAGFDPPIGVAVFEETAP